jgi:cell division protein FtsB
MGVRRGTILQPDSHNLKKELCKITMIGEQENYRINFGSVEMHFSNNGKYLSIKNLIELNMMLLDIQELLPECIFEISEVRKGSIVEIITGELLGVSVLATILYKTAKGMLDLLKDTIELKKSDKEVKKIEAETKKIEEETRELRIENDTKECYDETDKEVVLIKNELPELFQMLCEHTVDIKCYTEHSSNADLLKKAMELNKKYPVKMIILTVSEQKFVLFGTKPTATHVKIPYELQGNA